MRIRNSGFWHRLRAATFGGMTLVAVGSVHSNGLIEQASALQQQGSVYEAFALLDAQEAVRAGDPVFDKTLAALAEAAGFYTRALLAWERVLQGEPDNLPAQDAQARLLQILGDGHGLQALPDAVRQRSMTVDAARSIDQHLYSYDRPGHGGRSSWHGSFDLGLGHDSNVNAGLDPGAVVAQITGVPAWTVDPAAWERSSGYVALGLTLRGRYQLTPQWSVVGGGYMAARQYSTAAENLEPSEADGHLGVALRSNRHEWVVSARGLHEARDGKQVRGSAGVQGEWIYRMDGLRQLGVFVQSMDMRYPGQRLRDVRRTVAGLSHALVLRNGSIVYFGLYAGEESPRRDGVDDLGHRLMGARLGGQWMLHPRWAVYASADAERRRFGAMDPFFTVQRKDVQWRLAVGVSWLPAPGWRVTPQVEWTDVDSTLPIFTYQRRQVSVTVRREF
ncbi:MAG: hypothetical protein C0492_08015 [Verminephrobacter sp.]|nr:hypothetical protein [Verminephrobacter sp.]